MGVPYNKTLIIQRKTITSDGQGGWLEVWSENVLTSGRVSKRSPAGNDSILADRGLAKNYYSVYVPSGTDVKREDRVVCGLITMRVLSVSNPSQSNHHLELIAEEQQAGSI